MTRRFLSLLIPGAAAQVVTTTECKTANCGQFELVKRKPKPPNGQCPVCGTMSTPYIIPSGVDSNGFACEKDKCWPITQQVRCSHCSVSFWMNGENP